MISSRLLLTVGIKLSFQTFLGITSSFIFSSTGEFYFIALAIRFLLGFCYQVWNHESNHFPSAHYHSEHYALLGHRDSNANTYFILGKKNITTFVHAFIPSMSAPFYGAHTLMWVIYWSVTLARSLPSWGRKFLPPSTLQLTLSPPSAPISAYWKQFSF